KRCGRRSTIPIIPGAYAGREKRLSEGMGETLSTLLHLSAHNYSWLAQFFSLLFLPFAHEELAVILGAYVVWNDLMPVVFVALCTYAGTVASDFALYGIGAGARRLPWLRRLAVDDRVRNFAATLQRNLFGIVALCRVVPGAVFVPFVACGWDHVPHRGGESRARFYAGRMRRRSQVVVSAKPVQPPISGVRLISKSQRAPPPARDSGSADSPQGRKRHADIPAFAFAPARAQVINDETFPAAHLGQGLLHRTHAANLVCREFVAVPARLPFAVVEPVNLGLVPALDHHGFEIGCALGVRHESIRSESSCQLDRRQDGMIAGRGDDDPSAGQA